MKMSKLVTAVLAGFIAGGLPCLTAFGGTHVEQIYVKQETPSTEKLVFITGSNIPQRVHVWETGADTAWPLRIIGPREIRINHTGQRGTADIFATEPSVRVIGR